MSKRSLRWLFLYMALSCSCSSFLFSQEKLDVIYLKSGSKIIGRILEKQETQFVTIQLQSSEKLTIPWDTIKAFDVLAVSKVDSTVFAAKILESSKNALYFEALGVGGWYSLNYDRMISGNLSIRVGYSSWSILVSFTGVPVMINYLAGDGNGRFEVGAGLEYAHLSAPVFFTSNSSSGSIVLPIGTVGYRYQPKGGGFFFRADFVTLPSIGLSCGFCF